MELNITAVWQSIAPMDYSASRAEIGQSAGPDTWRAACDDSSDYPILDTEEKRAAFRVFVRSSGGWDDDEIKAWSDSELNALCLQWIAGDIREACQGCKGSTSGFNWEEYEAGAESGQNSSRLFRAEDGSIYFDISE
jgi:hypothetical protein